ncbi:uncharacterized protein LOC110232169%2C partial [Xyrichtys novacula]|uniref:Uncharacterized protein LOC110232169, partial n=1 Tax=Xyrichtys novacula TaxID=13765 RepID=A0AAV1HN08_XYRNO|nr:uncharacterized protein LOC110232169%2C partial [Xyrichtys novacula]
MAVTLASFTSFFQDEGKSIKRGENHYKLGHVESGSYAGGEIVGRECKEPPTGGGSSSSRRRRRRRKKKKKKRMRTLNYNLTQGAGKGGGGQHPIRSWLC